MRPRLVNSAARSLALMYASAAEGTVTCFHVSDGLELSLFVNRELPLGNHSTQLASY
jgi:hypothetical protein